MSTISLPDPTIAPERVTPVTSSYHARVDARPEAARVALDRLEPLPRLARALRALCVGQGAVRRSSSPLLRDEGGELAKVTLTWIVSLAARVGAPRPSRSRAASMPSEPQRWDACSTHGWSWV